MFHIDLTTKQVNILQSMLPLGFSFQIAQIQTKRQRTIKKIDQSFQIDFERSQEKKQHIDRIIPDKKTIYQQFKQSQATILAQNSKNKLSTKTKQAIYDDQKIKLILQKLKNHRSSYAFRQPVDPIKQGVPHYLQIIKNPMDLKTVQKKLQLNKYSKFEQFDADIRTIIENSYIFNPQYTTYFAQTQNFEKYYQQLLEKVSENQANIETKNKNEKTLKGDVNSSLKQDNKIKINQKYKLKQKNQKLNQLQLKKLVGRIQKLPQQGLKQLIIIFKSRLNFDWGQCDIQLSQMDSYTIKLINELLNRYQI